MRTTRKMVVEAIIRNCQAFPNRNLIRREDDLIIELFDGRFNKRIFKVHDFPRLENPTYYETWKHLKNHEELPIVEMIESKEKRMDLNEIKKEFC